MTPVSVSDVDESLSRADLLVPLIRTMLRRRPALAPALAPALPRLAMRLHAGQHHSAKEALLAPLLRGVPVSELDRIRERIAAAASLNAEVLAALQAYRAAGESVWVASAQVTAIVAPLARRVGADSFVATALEARDGVLTGRIAGPNNRGAAKVAALDAALPEGWRADCTAYSDGDADTPLLACVARPMRVASGRLLPTPTEVPDV